MWLSQTQRG
ncbi:hypothetical protein LINPERHAP1_LOCUS5970 [Linum perenne]